VVPAVQPSLLILIGWHCSINYKFQVLSMGYLEVVALGRAHSAFQANFHWFNGWLPADVQPAPR
jgi:hypothetical protein